MEFFFYLTQSRVWLVWTSVRFLFDCDPISLGFNMLHCDLASVVDQTAIFMWSNWVRLGFSVHFSVSFWVHFFMAFSVRFQRYFSTISTRFPCDSTVAVCVLYTWSFILSVVLRKTATRNDQILRSSGNANLNGDFLSWQANSFISVVSFCLR